MADIAVRKNAGGAPVVNQGRELEPYQLMRELLRWDPFGEMSPSWPESRPLAFAPAFEVKEVKNAYLFKADLPGVKEADLEVTMTGNRLTVTGKREEEHEEHQGTYFTRERSYGQFTRAFTLPEGADATQVHADLKAGVLTIAVPKRPEVQPKKVAIGSGERPNKS